MPRGIIVKGIGGLYYVKIDNRFVECRARGRLRYEKMTPLVGDVVEIQEQGNSSVINEILPRKSELIRPSVANVDQTVIVFAAAKPEIDFNLLERILLLIEHNSLKSIICINKIDQADISQMNEMISPYKAAGYKIIFTSTLSGYGIDTLKESLKDSINVFAGPSGVGKTTILNMLIPGFNLKTGDLSDKIGRGKHTTRHAELLELEDGGFVVDTPGFSSLDTDFISIDELEHLYPEFRQYIGLCKFSNCSHTTEPGCAVKKGVHDNVINSKRYESYVKLYDEINKLRRKYK